MGITFGIITNGDRDISDVLQSIVNNNIEHFEIIVVGGFRKYENFKVTYIEFDESIKTAWITRKKNLITKYANYEDIVYMHDYILLSKDWYKNYNTNYDICCNRILNPDKTRFRDWCLNELHMNTFRHIGMKLYNRNMIIPYNYNFSKFMYISGSYFLAKKYVMEEFPLDENLVWGQGEDVYWSMDVLSKYNFTMNERCEVYLTKYKELALDFIDETDLKLIDDNYKNLTRG